MCLKWFKDIFEDKDEDEGEPYIEQEYTSLEPPKDMDPISASEINTILHAEFPDATLLFADDNYKTVSKAELIRFLTYDKTNLFKYVNEYYDCPLPIDVAYGMGMFFADGTCGERNWRLVNKNKDALIKIQDAFNQEFDKENICFKLRLWNSYKKGSKTNYGPRNYDEWCLDLYAKDPKGFKRIKGSGYRKEMIKEFRNMFYRNKFKKVPAGVIESDLQTKKSFLEGVIEGDGSMNTKNTGTITINGKMGLCGICKLMMDLNWKFYLIKDKRHINDGVYSLCFNKSSEEFDESRNACDDFSFALMGHISNPSWGALPFGIVWTKIPGGAHAVNCFIDKNRDVWIVEPQNDAVYKCPSNWEPYLVMI